MTSVSRGLRNTFGAVLFIQGVHFFEHVVQLFQIHVLGRPAPKSLGILGDLTKINGNQEWLHLSFNVAFLAALLWIAQEVRSTLGSTRGVVAFGLLAVGGEAWHVIEHLVVTGNMLAQGGVCPCSGILDAFVFKPWLHFAYNLLPFVGLLAVARPILRRPDYATVADITPQPTRAEGAASRLAS